MAAENPQNGGLLGKVIVLAVISGGILTAAWYGGNVAASSPGGGFGGPVTLAENGDGSGGVGATASAKLEGGGSAPYNASDKAACMHLHNILVDVHEGILTVPELRDKLQEVRGDAVTTEVKRAATEMLSAVTTGRGVEMATASAISACKLT